MLSLSARAFHSPVSVVDLLQSSARQLITLRLRHLPLLAIVFLLGSFAFNVDSYIHTQPSMIPLTSS
jgi:hypothetical protein